MKCNRSISDQLFPNAEQLCRAFRGEVAMSHSTTLMDAASAMIPVHHKRREVIRLMRTPEALSTSELRCAVSDFNAVEIELATLATKIDHAVANTLRGRRRVSGVWHTETVGLVVSRMAGLWLKYLDSSRHEDAFWVARMSDAYNCLITDLTEGRRLPPDV
ncbi:hypothetical protein [Nocardia sp. Marseille-Q1738]